MTQVTLESIQKSINDQTVATDVKFAKLEKSIKDQTTASNERFDELAAATKAGFDEMSERFTKVDHKMDKLERGVAFVQKQVDAVVTHVGAQKKEILKRPSRKEFNSLKKRVVILENAIA